MSLVEGGLATSLKGFKHDTMIEDCLAQKRMAVCIASVAENDLSNNTSSLN